MTNPDTVTIVGPKRRLEGFNSPEGYIRIKELAYRLGVTQRTVRRWHTYRQGPAQTKIGRQVYYRIEVIEDWLRSREKQPPKPPRRFRGLVSTPKELQR